MHVINSKDYLLKEIENFILEEENFMIQAIESQSKYELALECRGMRRLQELIEVWLRE